MRIFERQIIKKITKYFNSNDIIVLHGARQVGKTCILKYLQNELIEKGENTYYIDLEDLRFAELLNAGPSKLIEYLEEKGFLKKERLYLFIDEIQYLINPSNFLKLMHDHHNEKIKLIVSGSSSFEIKNKFKDSLVGRILNFEIYPLNFKEVLLFKNFHINYDTDIVSSINVKDLKNLYNEYVLYGGYPKIVLEKDVEKKEFYLQQVIDTYIRKDIRDIANVKDVLKFNKLLEVLAEQSGQLLNVTELANTAKLSRPTIENYLFLMENTYIIKLLKPYSTNLRSELFKRAKIFFYDTGIAHMLWLKTLPKTVLGNMFETSVFSELVKNLKKAELFHWRTQDKKEVDFIIKQGNKILPIEAKVSSGNFKASSINYFLEKYKIKKGFCVSLDITRKSDENMDFKYPWELSF